MRALRPCARQAAPPAHRRHDAIANLSEQVVGRGKHGRQRQEYQPIGSRPDGPRGPIADPAGILVGDLGRPKRLPPGARHRHAEQAKDISVR